MKTMDFPTRPLVSFLTATVQKRQTRSLKQTASQDRVAFRPQPMSHPPVVPFDQGHGHTTTPLEEDQAHRVYD